MVLLASIRACVARAKDARKEARLKVVDTDEEDRVKPPQRRAIAPWKTCFSEAWLWSTSRKYGARGELQFTKTTTIPNFISNIILVEHSMITRSISHSRSSAYADPITGSRHQKPRILLVGELAADARSHAIVGQDSKSFRPTRLQLSSTASSAAEVVLVPPAGHGPTHIATTTTAARFFDRLDHVRHCHCHRHSHRCHYYSCGECSKRGLRKSAEIAETAFVVKTYPSVNSHVCFRRTTTGTIPFTRSKCPLPSSRSIPSNTT